MGRQWRRLLAAMAATLTASLAFTATALPASASNKDGLCESGEFCLYWTYNFTGSMMDFNGDVNNYASYTFQFPGGGQGQSLNDNAASAKNRGRYWHVLAYEHSYFRGNRINFYPGDEYGYLGYYSNRLSSHMWSPW
jgi:hypothetical protein